MTTEPNQFELYRYGVFDEPFDTIEQVAQYLIHPDNDAPAYTAIRNTILGTCGHAEFSYWSVQIVEMVTNIPESRMLMINCPSKGARFKLAVSILNAAMWLVMNNGDSDEGDIEEEGR